MSSTGVVGFQVSREVKSGGAKRSDARQQRGRRRPRATELRGAEVVVLDEAGHSPHVERPAEVAALIRAFDRPGVPSDRPAVRKLQNEIYFAGLMGTQPTISTLWWSCTASSARGRNDD